MSGEPGIVIVTHNSAEFLAACLESALERSPNVVVVDNLSTDSTCEVARRFPSQLIANKTNKGFAAAVNQGVSALKTSTILILNPDARLLTPLTPMLDYFPPSVPTRDHQPSVPSRDREGAVHQPKTGAVGGRLQDEHGVDQAGFAIRRFPSPASLIFECLGFNRLWPGNPVNKRYRALDADLSVVQEAEQPAGAFLLFPRDVWQSLGGFDERFHPLWFEDVDFLRRVSNAGYRIWYEPAARAAHSGAHSIQSLQPSDRQRFWYGNLLRYASIHFESDVAVRLLAMSVLCGVGMRRLLRGAPKRSGRADGASAAGLAWAFVLQGRLAAGPALTGKNDKKAI